MFDGLSDDQIALIGSAAAVVLSATIMFLSHYVGRALRGRNARLTAPLPANERRAPGRRAA